MGLPHRIVCSAGAAAVVAFASALCLGDEPAPPRPTAGPDPAVAPPAADTSKPTVAPKPEDAPKPTAVQAPAPAAAAPVAPERSALRDAVERVVGAEVHGRFTVKWESRIVRGAEDGTDHDLRATLDVRVGDEARDRFSGALLVRGDWDLDQPNRRVPGRVHGSLADTFDHELSGLLFTAYGQWRPESSPFETVRFGRQYVDVAETFHVDGVAATTRPLADAAKLRFTAYAGVPVHFYEARSSGDWIAGLQATAEPWKGTRGAFDYAHVEDELSGYTNERNDLAALSVWHALGTHAELFGRFTWLDGARDIRLRGTVNYPSIDLLLQLAYKRTFEDERLLATEFDPYFAVLRTYHQAHVGEVRAVKGFGDKVQVEAGASARELVDGGDEGPFNRETRRVWLTPSVDDLFWDGSTISAGVESWSGDGQRIRTWNADVTHRFSRDARVSVGTDFSLYDYGRIERGEREHVRSVYARADVKLTERLSLGLRYSWERDEEETYHVVSLALSVEF